MVPSLVDLCIEKWIDNVEILADVSKIDDYLLDLMLPLCSVDQLKHVEGSTKGIDLSPVTDKYWKTFYEKRFGNNDGVIEKMRENKVPFKWKQAYEYKEEEIKVREQMRRLMLKEYKYDYRGAGYSGSNSTAREEIGSLNSEEDEEEEVDEETDIEEFLDRVVGGRVYVEEEDEETDAEECLERVVGGRVYVKEEDEETDSEDFLERVEGGRVYVKEDGEETDIEEFWGERVVGVVPTEEEDEETDVEEEDVEEEEQTQIEEGEDDGYKSEVGQEEDGCGDYGCDDDDGYGDDYGYDDDYSCDCDSDNGYDGY